MTDKAEKIDNNSRNLLKDEIIGELRTLRKGRGLTAWKLANVPALRRHISEHTGIDADMLSADQIYSFLTHELERLADSIEARATQNAFGIGSASKHPNLIQRRSAFADQVGRHADTIEIYENHGIEEIANHLLRATQPIVLGNSSLENISQSHESTAKMAQAARNMIVQGLGDLYSLGSHAPEILRTLGKGTSPYLDTTVELTLLPSKRGDQWYNYNLRYLFRTQKSHFRIGIVSTAHDCEILMASGLVDDVIKLNANQDARSEISLIIEQCQLSIHDADKGTQESFRFHEYSETRRRELLSSVWQLDPTTCFILEAELVEVTNHPSLFYEYRWSFDMPIDNEHYAFWYAPGLMYLNSITIDTSRFPRRNEWNIFIQPFLGPIFPGALEPTKDRYTLAASGWIMQCHGVAIIWHKALPSA